MLRKLEEDILNGYLVSFEEARNLWERAPLDELCEAADRIRKHFMGDRLDTCSIMNARSGRCSEDCKWCSQSAHHTSNVAIYPLTSTEEALKHAMDNHSKGIGRFSLVTSGRTMTDREVQRSCEIYREIGKQCQGLKLCASMGLLKKDQLQALKDAGIGHYHCNIETAPSFFGELCSTHTMEEKFETIRAAKEVGLRVCSGGIIGMGESLEQRLEMAFALREIGADSIPVNILNPIAGTKLENQPPLPAEEIIRTFAIYRIIHPTAYIRFAGGRAQLSPQMQEKALKSGVNAALVGDLLTTIGSAVSEDMELFDRCGFNHRSEA